MEGSDGDPTATVLVVDDERDVGALFAAFLGDGYDVRTATSAEEALELVDEEIDLALIDRRMPEVTGDELVRELRARGFDIPIALVSAADPDAAIIPLAIDGYVTKPVTRQALLEVVDCLLDVATYGDERRERFGIAAKLAALESHDNLPDPAPNEESRALLDRLAALDGEIEELPDGCTLDGVLSRIPHS